MKFYRKLYLGEGTKKHWKKIVWKLKHRVGQIGIFVLALSEGQGLLEIYHNSLLQQKYYKKYPPFIIGIAKGYDEATNVAVDIIKEVYEKTGGFDVKNYLLKEKGKEISFR